MIRKVGRAIGANYVNTFDPNEVTTVSTREEPGELPQADIDRIWRSVVAYYETGLHPAMAVCIRHRGKVIIDRALGHVRGNCPGDGPEVPKEKATPDHLYSLFSASKAVTAMVIHLLDDEGLLHLDDAVEEYIPGFGQKGKGGNHW